MPAGIATNATATIDVLGGAHSKAPGKIDLRTMDAKFLRRVKAQLVKHCGGTPSPPEFLLIDQASILVLQLARLDERIVAGTNTAADDERHSALLQRLCRILAEIGMVGEVNHAPSLNARIAMKGRRAPNGEPNEPVKPEPPPEPEVVIGQPQTRRTGGIEVSRGLTADQEREKRLILGDGLFSAIYGKPPSRRRSKKAKAAE
jgi:hypothetical protein